MIFSFDIYIRNITLEQTMDFYVQYTNIETDLSVQLYTYYIKQKPNLVSNFKFIFKTSHNIM